MFNTKSRAMRGLIMLAILFGLFITGIEVTPNRRGKGKQKISDLEEMRKPFLDYGESEQSEHDGEETFPASDLTKGKNVIDEQFASMNLVEENESMEVNSLPTVDVVRDMEQAKLIYTKEMTILKHGIYFFQPKEQQSSSSSAKYSGIILHPGRKLALVYITYLSFWMAVNFRLCSVLFSLLPAYSYEENIKLACDEHFATMAFAFTESQKILDSLQHIRLYNKELQQVEGYVLGLALDFVMYENELKERTPADYKYYAPTILWNNVPTIKISKKRYKTNFRSISSFRKLYHREIDLCNTHSEMFEFLFNILNSQIKSDIFTETSEIIRCNIYGMSYDALREKPDVLWPPTWFTSNYENTEKMWQHVAKTEFRKPINTEDVNESMRTVIQLIHEIRNVDYTLAYGSLP